MWWSLCRERERSLVVFSTPLRPGGLILRHRYHTLLGFGSCEIPLYSHIPLHQDVITVRLGHTISAMNWPSLIRQSGGESISSSSRPLPCTGQQDYIKRAEASVGAGSILQRGVWKEHGERSHRRGENRTFTHSRSRVADDHYHRCHRLLTRDYLLLPSWDCSVFLILCLLEETLVAVIIVVPLSSSMMITVLFHLTLSTR